MTITDDHLLLERPHPIGGKQRIYRFAGNYGLSLVNGETIHAYPFAWEAAVINGLDADGNFDGLDYSTPLTSDVEVFASDEEANAFIARAADHFGALTPSQ